MARRKSSNSNNSGCLGLFLLIGLVVYVFQNYWPVILVVAGIVFIIWAISKSAQNRSSNDTTAHSSGVQFDSLNQYHATGASNTNASSRNDTRISAPVISQYSGTDPNICHEINRQITEVLNRRNDLRQKIDRTQKTIWRINKSLGGLNQEKIQKRDALVEQKEVLEGRLNASVYTFREPSTPYFVGVKSAFETLRTVDAKPYDGTPAVSTLAVHYNPIGDMKFILFSAEPLCLSLGGDIFCIIPSYVVRFKKDGTYVTTYSSKALNARVESWSYVTKETRYTWRHTNKDGGPDLRYRDNPRISYQVDKTNHVPNMLFLELAGATLKYEISLGSKRNEIASAIGRYTTLIPSKSYDPVYHVVRLLDTCDPKNSNIHKIQTILNGTDTLMEYEDNETDTEYDQHRDYQAEGEHGFEEVAKPSKAKRFFKGFLKVAVAGTAIIAGVTYGPSVVGYIQDKTGSTTQFVTQATVAPTVAPTAVSTAVPTEEPLKETTSTPQATEAAAQFISFSTLSPNDSTTNETPVEYKALSKGDKSADVRKLNDRLVELGYLKGSWADNYGTTTQLAVRHFQQDAGLAITGIADEETQALLYAATGIAQEESVQENITSEPTEISVMGASLEEATEIDVEPSSAPTLESTPDSVTAEPTIGQTTNPTLEPSPMSKQTITADSIITQHAGQGLEYARGSKGDAVKYIQQMLIDQSFLPAGQADGSYGPKTEAAVSAFQESVDLPQTGIADITTLYSLSERETGFEEAEGQNFIFAGLQRFGVYYSSGGIYIGLLRSDQSYQEGTLIYNDGTTYAGTFTNNLRNGKGEAWYPNGDYYSGNWSNDLMNGKGVYHFGAIDSVEQYDGEWKDGKMSGKGVYTMSNGNTIKGKWENNQQVGWWK